MCTYIGDANWTTDESIWMCRLGVSDWFNGDFKYDGKIDVLDYGIIDFDIGIQEAPFAISAAVEAAAQPSVAPVPEPELGGAMKALAAPYGPRLRRSRRERQSSDVRTPI